VDKIGFQYSRRDHIIAFRSPRYLMEESCAMFVSQWIIPGSHVHNDLQDQALLSANHPTPSAPSPPSSSSS
jgi:hypothetical protein